MSDDPNKKSGDPSGDDPRDEERTPGSSDAGGSGSAGEFHENDACERLTSEEELDKMLAHAGGLAQELATDVGANADDSGVMVTAEDEGDDGQSVDAMLSELDDLVAAAAEEIDPAEGSAARADHPGTVNVEIPPPTDEAAEDADAYGVSDERQPRLDVPDFMREFTEPAEDAADDAEPIGPAPSGDNAAAPPPPPSGEMTPLPPPPINEPSPRSEDVEDADDAEDAGLAEAAESKSAVGDVPDFMLEFTEPAPPPEPAGEIPATEFADVPNSAPPPPSEHKPVDPSLGVVGAPVVEDEAEAEAELEEAIHDVDAELQERAQAGADESAALELKGMAALKAKIVPFAEVALAGAGRALDVVDAPLSRRDPRFRVLTGFLALSTLGTAVIVYLITLF